MYNNVNGNGDMKSVNAIKLRKLKNSKKRPKKIIPSASRFELWTAVVLANSLAKWTVRGIRLSHMQSASVVLGYRARLEIQGSRVQTRLRSMDFLRT